MCRNRSYAMFGLIVLENQVNDSHP